ncbi:hypothetical protein GX51_04847 [Blastomyces parvus]|uniref:Dipeptidyl-peptidase III n=1 Tax=Blastomyces parvus TaxID=2060905 RepID=A0A2B7X010_9EURO|nr:hypothetical protein GX51_04847 [Blastomyces parvus]
MADALCGPSNALQSFQKHTSVDRTLQQDRILSRHSPAQGFRSQNHNEGTLDPEFNAFEAGVPAAHLSDIQHPASFLQPAPQNPSFNHTENSGWASDFQNLQISGPGQRVPQQQFRPESSSSGWQNEFMQHAHQVSRTQTHQTQISQAPLRYGPAIGGMGFGGMNGHLAYQDASQSHFQEHKEEAIFDESAFETAFAEARAEIELQEQQLQNEEVTERAEIEPAIRIGADSIQPQVDGTNESDELARTAGQLLDSVSHDQSQKFKESNFLALMRQLRDREVTVDGDEFRQMSQPLHPGGQYYPERKRTQQLDSRDTTSTTTPPSTTNEVNSGISPAKDFEQPVTSYPKSRVPYETPDVHWSCSNFPTSFPTSRPSPSTLLGIPLACPSQPHAFSFPISIAPWVPLNRHCYLISISTLLLPSDPDFYYPCSPNTAQSSNSHHAASTVENDDDSYTAPPPHSPSSASSSSAPFAFPFPSPSSYPPPFSSIYSNPDDDEELDRIQASVTESGISPLIPAFAPAPPFKETSPSPAQSPVVLDTKAALSRDKTGEASGKGLDDREPPPPYTEGYSPLQSFTYVMAAAGGAASIITQVQQTGGGPLNTLGDIGGDEHITLDLRGTRFTLSRDELLTLPEFVLLSLFPNGLLPDGHMGTFHEGDVYPVDYDPASLQYMLDFFRSVAQSIPSSSPSPTASPEGDYAMDPMHGSTRDMLQGRAGIIVLREDLDFYAIPPVVDIDHPEMIEVKRAAGRALLKQDGIFSGLRKSDEPGSTEQHLIEMLTAGGFNHDDRWGHRAGEPNKAVICSLALAKLRTDIRGDLANNNAFGMAQKLLLFWRKPARRCWWEGVELEGVEGVEGKLKVWIRRVWTLEMVSACAQI